MKIDLVASMPHYMAHMLPIFEALPDHIRGRVMPLRNPVERPTPGRAALVAGWQDVSVLSGTCPMVYVEHGAGQTYRGDPNAARMPGYSHSGGERHAGVIGYISPNQMVADRWKRAPAFAAGCPKLDRWVGYDRHDPWSVCFAFHWDATDVCPEARSAVEHYRVEFPLIVDAFRRQGFDVYGHAHPRWGDRLDSMFKSANVDAILSSDVEVFGRCNILFVDNSSLGVEFMALGRQTVWLNAPWYRKGVDHGGRFWDWTENAMTVDGPEDLIDLDLYDAFHERRPFDGSMKRLAEETYGPLDGKASQRAADWITDLLARR